MEISAQELFDYIETQRRSYQLATLQDRRIAEDLTKQSHVSEQRIQDLEKDNLMWRQMVDAERQKVYDLNEAQPTIESAIANRVNEFFRRCDERIASGQSSYLTGRGVNQPFVQSDGDDFDAAKIAQDLEQRTREHGIQRADVEALLNSILPKLLKQKIAVQGPDGQWRETYSDSLWPDSLEQDAQRIKEGWLPPSEVERLRCQIAEAISGHGMAKISLTAAVRIAKAVPEDVAQNGIVNYEDAVLWAAENLPDLQKQLQQARGEKEQIQSLLDPSKYITVSQAEQWKKDAELWRTHRVSEEMKAQSLHTVMSDDDFAELLKDKARLDWLESCAAVWKDSPRYTSIPEDEKWRDFLDRSMQRFASQQEGKE